ncbi:tol-pal system protein YbgF [Microbulbifer thermotolerans]|uniref:tol-pal system protein YbgF n=1 Tax=Microbulbifer thermotolerans TaxID=252514 RepID=UPI00224AEB43|nr:tol-pal system protein YbgF [Microbulbifer thermotolerans]MCX2779531.1 tol-pal system protein YbgF [Microbulbifer thermotolerans]MCX2805659.1 tol-pal system protein YbgF [Microbulbifer thermotolerans]MCX2840587.1 tol-pal system protein YbgF [Microbulbifer thermotolerans]
MALTIRSIAIAAAMLAAASPVFSQAPIVDLSSDSDRQSAPAYPDSSSSDVATYPAPISGNTQLARAPVSPQRQAQAGSQADAYYQMQVLQQEVQMLRGAVEELRHEVKRLKQQRTNDYMDLDRRIARLAGTQPAEQPPEDQGAENSPGGTGTAAPAPAVAASGDEHDRYQASFGLARSGDYDGASAEFKRLLKDYPNGKYAPNANYWLGEIALVQGNLEEARQWFVALLDGYPNSTKVWDGRYKLGTVYHQMGEQEKARELLEQVAASDARASGLAKRYLEENF